MPDGSTTVQLTSASHPQPSRCVVLGSFDVVEGGIYYIDRASGEREIVSISRPGGFVEH